MNPKKVCGIQERGNNEEKKWGTLCLKSKGRRTVSMTQFFEKSALMRIICQTEGFLQEDVISNGMHWYSLAYIQPRSAVTKKAVCGLCRCLCQMGWRVSAHIPGRWDLLWKQTLELEPLLVRTAERPRLAWAMELFFHM